MSDQRSSHLRRCRRFSFFGMIVAFAVLGGSARPAIGAAWYVAPGGSDGNSCTSPAAPCATVQGAVDKADPGDTVLLAVGTYTASGATSVVTLPEELTLDGGWDPGFTAPSGRSTLDGEGARRGLAVAWGVTAAVRRLAIVNGWTGDFGGGIRNEGTLTVESCHIRSNSAYSAGGGIFSSGSLTLRTSGIVENVSGQNAGGVYSYGTLVAENVTIASNTAFGVGGGLLKDGDLGSVLLANVTLAFNRASLAGGLFAFGDVTIRNSIVNGNRSQREGGDCYGSLGALDYTSMGGAGTCVLPTGTGNIFGAARGLGAPVGAPAYLPLAASSPAVDAGDPSGCLGGGGLLSSDQRGAGRSGRCDMGAYEHHAPGAAAQIVAASGTPQRTAPRAAFLSPLVAAVLDASGTPVGGVSVDFTAPASGASAGLPSATSATVVTDSSGLASVPARANATPGSYTVSAGGTGLGPPVEFSLVNAGWYVSPTGDDAAGCSTPSTPCATVEGALAQAGFRDGDTVLLAAGRYRAEYDPLGPSPAAAVVLNRSARLVGGWGASFAAQDGGPSILDGEGRWSGLQAAGGTVSVGEAFVIEGGATAYSGGGVRVGGDLTLVNVTVARNSARRGGGIHNGGFLTLDRSRVEGNMASEEGGGILNEGHLFVTGSAILSNQATHAGGVENAEPCNLVLEISTVSGNHATAGAGGLRSAGTAHLNGATVAHNDAGWGGGLEQTAGDVWLRNTIVGHNTASTGPDCRGSLTSLGHNLIGDDSGCDVVPATGDLTKTEPGIGVLVGTPPYHPLLAGSPAIDAGDPAGCEGHDGPLTTDQRGLPRQGRCDIGAYEYAPAGPAATVYARAGTPQRAKPGQAFAQPLQAAVLDAVGTPVPSAQVGFRAPATGASGTFGASRSPATIVPADPGGIATAPAVIANGTGGTYLVSGSVAGVASPALFSLLNAGGLYVAPSGSDVNDCFGRTTPCATLAAALALASPGDTVYAEAGTYTGTRSPALTIDADATLSGGWNPGFTAQTATSVLDGQHQWSVLKVNATVTLERIGVRNGVRGFADFVGGIQNEGTLTLRLSDVSGNSGGGIVNGGTLTLERTTVHGNTNDSGAGGIGPFAGLGGTITIVESTISGNHSTNKGGGLDVGSTHGGSQTTTILNSTVSGNTADFAGGGIVNDVDGTLVIRNSTITANVGVRGGGGLFAGSTASTTVEGTILAGNVGGASFGGPDCLGGPFVSQGGNLIGLARDCQFQAVSGDIVGTLVAVDPRLGPLAANGGPTATHALLSGSPALDSGEDVACPTTDQRGRFRPADGDGNGQAACDRGAFEAAAPALVSLSVGDTSVVEGDENGASAVFTLALSAASTREVSVLVATADGSASAGPDYRAVSDAVAFPPGVTQRTFAVPILGDRFHETDETLVLRLSDPVNVMLSNAQGVATVLDDDPPGLVVSDTVATILSGQPAVAAFPVTLSPPGAGPVSVDFSTSDGTATAPADYTSVSGTLLFPPGVGTQVVAVPVAKGAAVAGTRTFFLTLANPSGGVALVEDQAKATLTGPGSFYTLTPCRILDTRNPDSAFGGPALAAQTGRVFTLAGRCGIPVTAAAVSVNLTVTGATWAGNVRLYPADNPLPLVSTINYTAGTTRANNGVVALGPGGRLVVYASQATGTVEAILDVTGYFE